MEYDLLMLGYQSIDIVCMINNKSYLLRNTNTNKTFNVNKAKYDELISIGEGIHNSIWESEDDEEDLDIKILK